MAELTPSEKEIWAGVKRAGATQQSSVSSEKDILKQNIEWSTYQSDITGSTVTSYSEHDTYLQNNAGFSASEADILNSKIDSRLTDEDSSGTTWNEYEDYVSGAASWEDWANLFTMETQFSTEKESTEGGSVAGIRLHENGGTTYDGVSVPAGAVEVYGTEVHFSQKGDAVTGSANFIYSNLTVSNTTPVKGEQITISADIQNTGSNWGEAHATLKEDGTVVSTKSVAVLSGQTETVSFDRTYHELTSVDVTIDGLSPVTVQVISGGVEFLS
jgi:hypothetical protein